MSISSQRSARSMIGASSSAHPCCCVNGCQRKRRSSAARSINGQGSLRYGRREGGDLMGFRKYRLGSYEEMRAQHSWNVPERYNIALDVCDKHERDRLAMIWEDWRGTERHVSFGELQDLSNRFANVLEAHGIERGDRVATLLPSLPETAAVFLRTYKRGAILLSMSVLYGDEGIEHRLSDSGAKVVVTDSANRHRVPDGLAEIVWELDSPDFTRVMDKASTRYET